MFTPKSLLTWMIGEVAQALVDGELGGSRALQRVARDGAEERSRRSCPRCPGA
jgi:hypothetical protein